MAPIHPLWFQKALLLVNIQIPCYNFSNGSFILGAFEKSVEEYVTKEDVL